MGKGHARIMERFLKLGEAKGVGRLFFKEISYFSIPFSNTVRIGKLFGKMDAEAETPILWSPDGKN